METNTQSVLRNFIASRAFPAVKNLLEPVEQYVDNQPVALFGIELIHKVIHTNLNLAIKKVTTSLDQISVDAA